MDRPVTLRDLQDLVAATTRPPRISWRTVWAAAGVLLTAMTIAGAAAGSILATDAELREAEAAVGRAVTKGDAEVATTAARGLEALREIVTDLDKRVTVLEDRARVRRGGGR